MAMATGSVFVSLHTVGDFRGYQTRMKDQQDQLCFKRVTRGDRFFEPLLGPARRTDAVAFGICLTSKHAIGKQLGCIGKCGFQRPRWSNVPL